MAVFSARAEHHPPTLNSRRDPEVHCDPRLSLSIPGQEAWQAARWSPESFAQMLSPPPIPPPLAGRPGTTVTCLGLPARSSWAKPLAERERYQLEVISIK